MQALQIIITTLMLLTPLACGDITQITNSSQTNNHTETNAFSETAQKARDAGGEAFLITDTARP